MSDKAKARRTKVEIAFGGTDITESIRPFLLSLTYTDNEEDETDDLQIKLQDRGSKWVGEWLDKIMQTAAAVDPEAQKDAEARTGAGNYTVTARSGLNVRSGPGTGYGKRGALPSGAAVSVSEIRDGWAKIQYGGKDSYVYAGYLKKSGDSAGNPVTSSQIASTKVVGGRSVRALFTAYGPFLDEGGPNAANGECLKPSSMTCAAPKSIPFGTKITIQGTGTSRDGQTYRVNDRGDAITVVNGVYHFDILMSTKSECYNWGKRYGTAIIGGSVVRPAAGGGVSAYSAGPGDGGIADDDKTTSYTVTEEVPVIPENPGQLRIQAVIARENWKSDGKDKILDCGQFTLDSVDASGPPSTVTLKATSLAYRASARKAVKTNVWENCSLSGIAREIASKNNMVCMFESDADPRYDRREQNKTSDIDFLSSLCHDAGISLKTTNNILVLFDQAEYEQKDAVLKIKRGDGSYINYKLNTGGAGCAYASCRVSYADPATKQTIEGVAYAYDYDAENKDNQQLELKLKVKDAAEAKELAEKQLRLYNKHEKTASFTLPGNPELVAGAAVELENWGPWSGKYIVKQAQHSVGPSGYRTKIILRWALSAVKPKTDKTKKTVTRTVKKTVSPGGGSASGGAAAFVAAAASQVGYRERGENITDYGNGGKAWCAYFVSWCAKQSGAPIPTTYGFVGDFTDYFRKKGLYKPVSSGYIPKPGDIMIQGTKHIGIVESATSSEIHTIDGNYSNSVKRVTWKYSMVSGFCTPWG